MQINCPHCATTNRIEKEKLAENPICGKCKKPIFSGQSMDLNSGNVMSVIQKNDIPVLVDCWAPWCGPCRSFAPIFEQACKIYEPNLRFAKLDTESVPGIGNAWRIQSIPTLILFHQGQEVQRISGALPLPQLKQWLQQSGLFSV